MPDTVIVLGSVTPPGRLLSAMRWFAGDLAAQGFSAAKLINLADHRIAFADGRPPSDLDDDTAAVVNSIANATTVILASPVYRGTYTGALKNLLDHVPVEALQAKPCGIVAMGASDHHYLGVDWQLREVLAWFGALAAPVSVYLRSADFADGELSAEPKAALTQLGSVLRHFSTIAPMILSDGPAPLAAKGR